MPQSVTYLMEYRFHFHLCVTEILAYLRMPHCP